MFIVAYRHDNLIGKIKYLIKQLKNKEILYKRTHRNRTKCIYKRDIQFMSTNLDEKWLI